MIPSSRTPTLSLFAHPYRTLTPVTGGGRQLRAEGRLPGSALVWNLGNGLHEQDLAVARARPGGLPLIVVFPPLSRGSADASTVHTVASARPAGILPYHHAPDPDDLAAVLRRPPEDLGGEVVEYLAWRGLVVDRDTRHLIRRTLALSADLRSISALCRSMYLSRRALGRRFVSRGLPVPSHWLHFGRLLRVSIRLQNTVESVLSVGYELGYGDAFALSNQMVRLTGYRPTQARAFLGWEWLVEAWLRREADTGGLAPDFTVDLLSTPGPLLPEEPRRAELRFVAERRGARPSRTRGGRVAG